MKFAKHLAAHITPEWRKQYIQYELMKTMIYAEQDAIASTRAITEDPEIIERTTRKFNDKFFLFCDNEVTKINAFFSEKLSEANRKLNNMKSDMEYCRTMRNITSKQFKFIPKIHSPVSSTAAPLTKQTLKLAFSEYYLSLILLQNYQELNYTGFQKILKKYDKVMDTKNGAEWFESNIKHAYFVTDKTVESLIKKTEDIVTKELGDRKKAMKLLSVPPLTELMSYWSAFRIGINCGAIVIFVVFVIYSAIMEPNRSWTLMVHFYRGVLLLNILGFLVGINIYGWRISGVNHVLVFELDPRKHMSAQSIMEITSFFTLVWAISLLLFTNSKPDNGFAFYFPLALVAVVIGYFVNPFRVMYFKGRWWLLKVLGRIVLAPFFYVRFADFWIADQLNSLVPAFVDLLYMAWFYLHGCAWIKPFTDETVAKCFDSYTLVVLRPIVSALPAWWRVCQCLRRCYDTRQKFPHLFNAAKYASTLFVITSSSLYFYCGSSYKQPIYNPYVYLWVTTAIINSIYAFVWDVKMDWGLFDDNAGENAFLREETVYPSAVYYYAAMIQDIILRFGWTLSLSLGKNNILSNDILVSILSLLEVWRRFIWNFFRLENEHLNNCGQFRAVRDISVTPRAVSAAQEEEIIKMMDSPDGVINRRWKVKTTRKGDDDDEAFSTLSRSSAHSEMLEMK